jgi:hypothetical protein
MNKVKLKSYAPQARKDGLDHTMEAVAYTWFNRFAALKYMELHDYLGHGHRALSSTAGGCQLNLAHSGRKIFASAGGDRNVDL